MKLVIMKIISFLKLLLFGTMAFVLVVLTSQNVHADYDSININSAGTRLTHAGLTIYNLTDSYVSPCNMGNKYFVFPNTNASLPLDSSTGNHQYGPFSGTACDDLDRFSTWNDFDLGYSSHSYDTYYLVSIPVGQNNCDGLSYSDCLAEVTPTPTSTPTPVGNNLTGSGLTGGAFWASVGSTINALWGTGANGGLFDIAAIVIGIILAIWFLNWVIAKFW